MRRFLTCIMALVIGAWLHTVSAEETNYLLGPGDVLKITVYNNPDLSIEARITERGLINFPLVGELHVGGITASAAEKRIAGMLAKGGFLKDPQINVLVTQFQSKVVSVLGSVYKPGRYPLDRATNLADLLALGGGVMPDGSDIVTIVSKSGKTEYDLRNIVGKGDGSQNVPLSGGETVYVPRAPIFYIYGEVQRPSSYRVERNMTVMQALAQGGGLTVRGTQRNIQLHRRNDKGVVEKLSPALTDLVQPDDVLYVQESLF